MGVDAEMFVRTTARVTPEDIKLWSYQLAAAFGAQSFNIKKHGSEPHHCLSIAKEGEIELEDGVVKAEPGETLIQVNFLCVRYYGPD